MVVVGVKVMEFVVVVALMLLVEIVFAVLAERELAKDEAAEWEPIPPRSTLSLPPAALYCPPPPLSAPTTAATPRGSATR